MNNSTRITLIMPAYNAAKYVATALDSIIDQTVLPDECIVVDDGSTDHTAEIIKKYSSQYRFIRLLSLPPKTGTERRTAKALNAALNEAHYEFIAWMDADDVCLPERLEHQLNFLQQHKDVVACGTQAVAFHDAWYKPTHKLQLPVEDEWLKLFCLRQSPFFQSAAMVRKSFLHAHALHYNEQFEYAEDYDFFSRVAQKGKVANLPEFTLRYRMHGEQSIKHASFESAVIAVIQRNVKELLGQCSDEVLQLLNHRTTLTVDELIASFDTATSLQHELKQKTHFSEKVIDAFIAYSWNRKLLHALSNNPLWVKKMKRQQSYLLSTVEANQLLKIKLKAMLRF
jgi:glycosyltransferase involved in cell wall biosynthesis